MHIFKPHQAIEIIATYLSSNPTIIEAGAFDGADTKRMATCWPGGTIHAFEPVPSLFEKLANNTNDLVNAHPYQLALSNTNGSATFYISEKKEKPGIACQAGSLHKPNKRLVWSPLLFPKTITVPTITLQTWAKKNNIKQIDCLWLDTQGHELAILQAAQNILKTVTAIFTEVGFIQNYEGQPTYEAIRKWLATHGFEEVGRDFENMNDWFFGNVLFVRKL